MIKMKDDDLRLYSKQICLFWLIFFNTPQYEKKYLRQKSYEWSH